MYFIYRYYILTSIISNKVLYTTNLIHFNDSAYVPDQSSIGKYK